MKTQIKKFFQFYKELRKLKNTRSLLFQRIEKYRINCKDYFIWLLYIITIWSIIYMTDSHSRDIKSVCIISFFIEIIYSRLLWYYLNRKEFAYAIIHEWYELAKKEEQNEIALRKECEGFLPEQQEKECKNALEKIVEEIEFLEQCKNYY